MMSSITISKLIKNSIQSSTRDKYARAWLRYVDTCALNDIPTAPVSTLSMLTFIGAEFEKKSAFNSLDLYISGILFMAKENDIEVNFDSQKVNQCRKGYRNCAPNPTSQEPVRLNTLRHFGRLILKENLLGISEYNRRMVWISFLFAFFGLMRVSEYTEKLLRIHIQDDGSNLRVKLTSTKNSQNRESFVLLANIPDTFLCPVDNFRKWVRIRDRLFPASMSLFRYDNGKVFSHHEVNDYIKILAKRLELTGLTSHSFRIGGASEAARAGVNAKVIQIMGRWQSDCFLRYIRPEDKDILDAQKLIALS
jgi:hypothetical protein